VSDGRASEAGGPGEITHCEWCGAEYDTTPAPRRPPPVPPKAPARSTPPAPVEGETHCEWCGAEYPVPEGGA
jgi:hypothetical protein